MATWFNIGGVLLHYLPNAVLGLLSSLVVEISLGSLNMLLVAVVSYGWTVWHGFCEDTLSGDAKGWGFSATLYQYFTVVGGALFIRYWCFNKVKDFTFYLLPSLWHTYLFQCGENNQSGFLWWCSGLQVILGTGWFLNGLIYRITYLVLSSWIHNIAHNVHDVMTLYG